MAGATGLAYELKHLEPVEEVDAVRRLSHYCGVEAHLATGHGDNLLTPIQVARVCRLEDNRHTHVEPQRDGLEEHHPQLPRVDQLSMGAEVPERHPLKFLEIWIL